jgi:hypothetical protein
VVPGDDDVNALGASATFGATLNVGAEAAVALAGADLADHLRADAEPPADDTVALGRIEDCPHLLLSEPTGPGGGGKQKPFAANSL